jgi:hypothetical protein
MMVRLLKFPITLTVHWSSDMKFLERPEAWIMSMHGHDAMYCHSSQDALDRLTEEINDDSVDVHKALNDKVHWSKDHRSWVCLMNGVAYLLRAAEKIPTRETFVERFHAHMNVAPKVMFDSNRMPAEVEQLLQRCGHALTELSTCLEQYVKVSPEALRAHLMIEELGEWCIATYEGNEVKALDALTDLQYVTSGTAVQYGWDLEGAFHEVHASNMSKTPNTGDQPRLRDKGEGFVPPQLEKFIRS